jgi:mannose-6-phosphate isomerase-like protein (cupin superfamily)
MSARETFAGGDLTVTRAGGGEHLHLLADLVTIKAGGAHTSGRIVMMEVTVPPGGGPPGLHRHESAEVFYVLEGTFEFTAAANPDHSGPGTVTTRVGAGDVVAMACYAWHNFKNVGAEPGRLLSVHSHAEMEGMARELGVPVAEPRLPSPPGEVTPEERSRLLRVVSKYVELLPAPGNAVRP